MRTLNVIGCGRVGKTLAKAWHTHGVLTIQDVLTTTPRSAAEAVQWLGAGQACAQLAQMRDADIWMVAVPDRAIAQTAQAMADTLSQRIPQTVFHCSGALASEALAPIAHRGGSVASAHCILSFADPQRAQAQLPGTPCGLEGHPQALAVLRPLFESLGLTCFDVNAEQKLRYHAAAVFATNFLPVLQAVAEQLWQDSGVPAALMPQLRARLLHHAVDNLMVLGPKAALTGPAARGDLELIRRQGESLAQWDATCGQAYQTLSELAGRLARAGDVTASGTTLPASKKDPA